ncbi:MAG TPA: hypothetical protein VF843_13115 [Streptosporangiaceae bacterium]
MDKMIDPDVLIEMSVDQRRKLMQALVAIEQENTPVPGTTWKWYAVVGFAAAACVFMVIWIAVLALTLPAFYHTGSWRGAWVGFDVAELVMFAACGWAAWRRRQILIICLIVLATLLLCDAWFDVVLDVRTGGFLPSLLSAVLVEVPLALLAILMARRLLRMAIGQMMRYEGLTGKVPPLWQIPLLGPAVRTPLAKVMRQRLRERRWLRSRWPHRRRGQAPPAD